MDINNFSIQEARQIDLVKYLGKLGYDPRKIRNQDYWYTSPLRNEKTPSFKVNKTINCWYDFGLGEGGSIIDFGIKYFNCSVKEFLEKLKVSNYKNVLQPALFFHRSGPKLKRRNEGQNAIKITEISSIHSPGLIAYINSRFIDLELAKRYCKEVNFELYNRSHTAIGFKNDTGGYELRNEYFKGSSSPKFTTLICSHKYYNDLAVFEGFFSFLAYQTALQATKRLPESQTNFLILNSLSFFEMSKSLMQRYQSVKLFLDRDKAGIKHTEKA